MTEFIKISSIFFLIVVLLGTAFHYLARYVIRYEVCDGNISILIFLCEFIHINNENIEWGRQASLPGDLAPGLRVLRMGNRLARNYVIVKVKRGFLYSQIAITPENPKEFILSLKK